MGWGRTLLLGDIGNRLDIEDTELEIANLRRDIQGTIRKEMSQDKKLSGLISENLELKLYLASVIRLLVTKEVISKSELKAVVDQIDLEDGSHDGKYNGNIF
ncbi:MAG TPA: hypothetical protein ENK89_04700 [Desulfobulbaceae bacterium]|nr:hypothetical protein [Desulfobulbaceae bacterium]